MMRKLHYFDIEKKAATFHPRVYDSTLEPSLLMKYFPKYQKEFSLFNQSGAKKSKLKRMKIIKNFSGTPTKLKSSSIWRVLLANKMKSMRYLNSHSQSPRQFSEKMKFFSRIESIRLSNVDISSVPYHQIDQYAKEACKYMRRLRSLNNLEFHPKLTESKSYVKYLNLTPKLLNSLETFKFYFDWQNLSDQDISDLIENSKSLLKNVTSLILGSLHSPSHFRMFQRLGELCPKISTLSFEFSGREVDYHETKPIKFYGQPFELNFNYLETLTVFQNLRSLNLNVADIFTLVKDLALPASIQHLRLEFEECLSKEVMLKIEKNFVDETSTESEKVFEENDLLMNFYENFKFKGLENLEIFEIIFPVECEERYFKYQNYLSHSLLKRISSPLKNLKVISTENPDRLKTNLAAKRKDPYLPLLLDSCLGFVATVKTLEIGTLKIMYSKFGLENIRGKFISLSRVKMSGKFTQFHDSNIENIGYFLHNIILLGDSITVIEFTIYIDPTAKALLSLLRQLNQLEKPKKLRIELWIYFFSASSDIVKKSSGMSFTDGINELKSDQESYSKIQGVFLKRIEKRNTIDGMVEFLKLYSERFQEETR